MRARPLTPLSPVGGALAAPRRRRPWRACAAALALLSTSLGGELAASAYCRTTTCTGRCVRNDYGCKTTGAKLFWRSVCVGWSLQRDGTSQAPFEAVEQAAKLAVLEWSDVKCPGNGFASITVDQLGSVTCGAFEFNPDGGNANVIAFKDNRWTYKSENNTLATTIVSFDTETGEIFDADILLNSAYNEYTVSDTDVVYDVQSIIAHEFGHFLGFDHSSDFDATMNAGYSEGSLDFRKLHRDDLKALCTTYPPRRRGACASAPLGGLRDTCASDPVPVEPIGGGACSSSGRPTASGGAAALLCVMAGLGAWRRARRSA